ncbi:hypothetical protein Cob_v010902 [Colletotrichum orbiculare MAFF 240422]|uniref:Uncharacterized protein n=1 Tax=Colletotrichum orbiculare (strain 104-T / ATCC 96160 / CBS 514.97 / LARS 414 / MAFF 240422) TaxID=1213857 RepID=N4VA10_COLOR|nr:hypothetical protein Cob_v010902 [Colletotrichum orbiculare MAFF 240422]
MSVKTLLDPLSPLYKTILRRQDKWENPLASIPDPDSPIEIEFKKKGKNKVWHANGPALELFDSTICPAVHALLVNTALIDHEAQEAPLFIRLYMVGETAEQSRPTVFICCNAKSLREDAESCVKRSDVVERHGFGLASSAFFLETKLVIVK